MKYVVDVNVALKWVLPEQDSDKAIALRDDYAAGVHDLITPDTFPVEAAHVLTRSVRQGIVADAQAKLLDVMNNAPVLHPYLPLLGRAIELSVQMRHGVFDCLYVALAERENCEVVTADQRMVNTFQGQFPFVIPLSTA